MRIAVEARGPRKLVLELLADEFDDQHPDASKRARDTFAAASAFAADALARQAGDAGEFAVTVHANVKDAAGERESLGVHIHPIA